MYQLDPILSICIITYNRCALLNRGLRAIAQQMVGNPPCQVEVIVSDNASSDETSQIIKEIKLEYPEMYLRYFRQPENIGAVRNYYFVVQAATGKFLFPLSDDDILLPCALGKIIKVIQAHPDLEAICPATNSFTIIPENGKPNCQGNDDLVMDRNQALIRLGTMLTFMSSVVFRRDSVSAAPAKNDTLFPQSFMFLAAIAREKGCLFLSQECLAVRVNESVSYDLIRAFVNDFFTVLQYAIKLGYSRQAIRIILSAHSKWLGGVLRQFRETSYRPSVVKRIWDTAEVDAVWWCDPQAFLRIEMAMWLPELIYSPIKKLFKRAERLLVPSR